MTAKGRMAGEDKSSGHSHERYYANATNVPEAGGRSGNNDLWNRDEQGARMQRCAKGLGARCSVLGARCLEWRLQAPITYLLAPIGANHYRLTGDKSSVMTVELLTIRQAIAGDEAALRALWTRHAPHIDLVVRRLVGQDHDLAADIAQEVWIQIFRALPSYRGDSQFGTWAHRIAVNRTLNALRKTRRLANLETEVEEDSAAVEMDTDRSFIAASIEEAAAKLSPGARAVFVLHDVEGFTHEEIARDLGITAGGSKSQLFKARAKLRKLLAHLVDGSSNARESRTDRGHVAPA
jgi:RNA polymerase sigma-70 factor (ECF subfamily)